MRHIRDPITGYCIICEKNNIKHFVAPNELDDGGSSTHGSTTDRSSRPTSRPRWNDPPGKKTIYVNAYPNPRSPSPSKKRPSSSLSSSSSSSDDSNSARKSTALSSRSTSKLVLVERSSPTPTPRNRSPSPKVKGRQRSPDAERGGRCCCKKTGRGPRGFDDIGRYEDRCCGYRNFETASFGAGTWGIRRWCAPLMALLALMALAGLAVGIYFGVKAAKEKNDVKQQVIKYIKGQQARYIIVGVDQPCNAFNNFTRPTGTATTPRPNCKDVTTKIVAATPKFVPPTDPEWLLAYTAASGASRLLQGPLPPGPLSLLASLGDARLLLWVVGGVLWSLLATSLGSGLYG